MTPQELKSLIAKSPSYLYVVDVRETDELTHMIPTSKSIPLSRWNTMLQLSIADFKKEFGFDKFKQSDKIVLVCFSGARSARAAQVLKQLGYDAHNMDGGMLNWK